MKVRRMFKSYLRSRGARASDKDRDSYVFSLLFNSYNESYYERGVQCSPSLTGFDPELSAKLTQCDKKINTAIKKSAIFALILLVIDLSLPYRNTVAAHYVKSFSALVFYSVAIVYPLLAVRLLNEERATLWLFFTIRELEREVNDKLGRKAKRRAKKKANDWRSSGFRYGIARRVERVARYVERIPLGFRGIAPSVRRDAMKVSEEKAQALRQLEASVIIPSSLTQTELIDRLKSDLWSIADNRWYELPDGQPTERVRSRWVPIFQITTAVLTIGLAIFVATLAVKMGPVYSLAGALLLSLGVWLLNRAGLPTEYLSDTLRQEGK
jgi:hypothetical protein